MTKNELKVMHFLLIVLILFLFSKFTIDALVMGAIAIYLYQQKEV
jgi:hypothetical protein